MIAQGATLHAKTLPEVLTEVDALKKARSEGLPIVKFGHECVKAPKDLLFILHEKEHHGYDVI